MSNRTNKVKVEKVLVADGNAALATVATNVTALTTDGQLGVYDASTNLAIDSSYLFTDSPVIYIAQGTGATTATYPLPLRKQEKSMPINGKYVISVQKNSYTAPYNNVWIIGASGADSGAINISDETVYELSIKFDGRRIDILNGRNQPAIFPQFETPDYSVDGPATTKLQRDHLLMNLATEINRNCIAGNPAGAPVVAYLVQDVSVDTDPGSVQKTVADLDDGSDTFTVGYKADGSRITWTSNAAESAGVAAAITAYNAANGSGQDIATADLLVPPLIATPPSGSAAETDVTNGDTAVAGTSYETTWLILVAVDPSLAYFDRIAQTKSRMVVGLRQGFNVATVTNYEGSKPFEGIGVGRHVNLFYQETDELRKFDTVQPPGAYSMLYDTPVDTTATYNSYTIVHKTPNVATNSLPSEDPFTTVVFIESGDTTTSAAFESLIRTWVASTPSGIVVNF